MQYKMSLEDQQFVDAIDLGQKMMAPVSPTATAVVENVALIAANYVVSPSASRAPEAASVSAPLPVASEASSPVSEFEPSDWCAANIGQIDVTFGAAAYPTAHSPTATDPTTPSQRKKAWCYHTPGSETCNRKVAAMLCPCR